VPPSMGVGSGAVCILDLHGRAAGPAANACEWDWLAKRYRKKIHLHGVGVGELHICAGLYSSRGLMGWSGYGVGLVQIMI
jgi:hypothetical protein